MVLPALLLPLLTAAAPKLIRMATGSARAEQVTQSVVTAVNNVTGIRPDTVEKAAEARQKLEADPELMAQLKARLQEVEEREFEAILEDRQNARTRDVELRQATGGRENWRANVMLGMAFVAILGIAGVLIVLSRINNAGNEQFVGTIIGFLTGIGGMFARNIGSAFDFEFGSSRGSKNKDDQITALTRSIRPSAQKVEESAFEGAEEGTLQAHDELPASVSGGQAGDASLLDRFRNRMAHDG